MCLLMQVPISSRNGRGEKSMKAKDLVHQFGMREPRPILFCYACCSEYSADPADYTWMEPEDEMTCCEEPLTMVTKRTVMEPVK